MCLKKWKNYSSQFYKFIAYLLYFLVCDFLFNKFKCFFSEFFLFFFFLIFEPFIAQILWSPKFRVEVKLLPELARSESWTCEYPESLYMNIAHSDYQCVEKLITYFFVEIIEYFTKFIASLVHNEGKCIHEMKSEVKLISHFPSKGNVYVYSTRQGF